MIRINGMFTRVVRVTDSSNIVALAYDPTNDVMRVAFENGVTYEYQNVRADQFGLIVSADSVGTAFNRVIRSNDSWRGEIVG